MRRHGFTLLELLLAIVIIIMVIGSVFAFYNNSLRLVNSQRESLAEPQLARLVLDQLAAELLSAPGLGASFGPILRGEQDRISFLTTVVPSRLVFFPRQLMDTANVAEHDLRRVEYRLAVGEREEPLGLKRSELRVLLAPMIEETADEELMEEPTPEPERPTVSPGQETSAGEAIGRLEVADEQILSEKIHYLEFQYYNGLTWAKEWTAEVLPRAVRIVIGFNEVPDEQRQDETNLVWADRPWHEDQYSLVVSLSLSEELKARSVKTESNR